MIHCCLQTLNSSVCPIRRWHIITHFWKETAIADSCNFGLRSCSYLKASVSSDHFYDDDDDDDDDDDSYMALQPISGLGLLFMRFRNLTHTDGW
jgi:hypothetical protein